MTLPLAERGRKVGRPKRDTSTTMVVSLRSSLLAMLSEARSIHFPSPRYRADPVAFCREILGVEPWAKQIEILEAIRDYKRVAVASGHKVGKSMTAAIVALWFFCSFEDARVVMTSTTSRQVDEILWRELRMIISRSGRCVRCKGDLDAMVKSGLPPQLAEQRIPRPCPHSAVIAEQPAEKARTGLRSLDFREISGFTAKEAEAVAGISGKNLLYLPDEASGIDQKIFDAIEGNRAGGARLAMFSNPTKNEGEFYSAFHDKSEHYHTITVSSEETPNAVAGERIIPGLAERAWIEEKREEWGEDSPLYKIRVQGKFATREDGKIFSVDSIARAEERWHTTPPEGRLYIGLDPAGSGGAGDESVFTARRGLKAIEQIGHRGLTEDAHLVHLMSMIAKHRVARETPVVVLDREGKVGSEIYGHMRAFVDGRQPPFELVACRASDRAHRRPDLFDRMRDELASNLESWFRDGGAIPESTKLAKDLHSLEWKMQPNGRLKVTPKDDIRKAIGRSPDWYDSLALACWEPLSLREDVPESALPKKGDDDDDHDGGIDPYGARGIDPYGGR